MSHAVPKQGDDPTAPIGETAAAAPVFHRGRAWFVVAVLLIFSLFSYLDRQIIALLVDPIKADLGLSDTQLGLLQGLAFAMLYAVAALPLGWAVDRYPRPLIMYLGITIWSLAAASCGLARNFWQMFTARTFVGVGEATLNPIAVSLISDVFPRDRVALPMGVYSAGIYLGGGASMAIGGWLIGLFEGQDTVALPILGLVAPWQAVFVLAGLPGLVVAFLAFAIREPRAVGHRLSKRLNDKENGGFIVFLRSRARIVAFAFGGFGCAAMTMYAVSAWTPVYFMRVFGWSASEIGGAFGLVLAVSGAFGALSGGALMDRMYRAGHTDAYFLAAGSAAAIAAPVLVLAYFATSAFLALVLLCIGLSMIGVMGAASYSTWRAITTPAVRGQLTSTFVFLSALAGPGLGPLIVGLLNDYAFQDELMVGYSIAIVCALALPLMSLLLFSGRNELRKYSD